MNEQVHEHIDKFGAIHKCYHNCKNVLKDLSFWIGVTISFPIEHLLWEKVYPFKIVAEWIGM